MRLYDLKSKTNKSLFRMQLVKGGGGELASKR